MDYDLELEKLVAFIKSKNANTVLIQLPDGLKPKAKLIQDCVRKELGDNIKIYFWSGSNFGACDIPLHVKSLGVDLIVHYGHSEWT